MENKENCKSVKWVLLSLNLLSVIFGVGLADYLLYAFKPTAAVWIFGSYVIVPLILLSVDCFVDYVISGEF